MLRAGEWLAREPPPPGAQLLSSSRMRRSTIMKPLVTEATRTESGPWISLYLSVLLSRLGPARWKLLLSGTWRRFVRR